MHDDLSWKFLNEQRKRNRESNHLNIDCEPRLARMAEKAAP
jgi:hypothetical protein